MTRMSTPVRLATLLLLGGCAEPNPQLPPPEEVLVVANSTVPSLSVSSITAPGSDATVAVSGTSISSIAARGSLLVGSLPNEDAAAVVALDVLQQIRTVGLPAGSGATGTAVLSDTVAYVANPNLNTVTRINPVTGDTASVDVGHHPQGLIGVRGSLFVVNGNVDPCPQSGGLCPLGPSWLTVVDPVTNQVSTGIDSIAMLGPGNARYATVGADGLLYVMSRGLNEEHRLSVIDPVGRDEIASFGGFGDNTGPLAADLGQRIFISSPTDGVMVFNTRTRTVVRGAGNGVAIPENNGVAVDVSFHVYTVQSGDCSGTPGRTVVLDSTLAPIGSLPAGTCAGMALVTLFPSGE